MNKILLAGELVGADDTSLTIKTIARTPNNTFENKYTVYFDEGIPAVSVGERVAVLAKFAKDLENDRDIRMVGIEVKDYTSGVDMNIARVSGIMAQGLTHFESVPSEKKRAFGDMLLIVENEFYVRGAILRAPAIIGLDRSGKFETGCEVQMEGRVNVRPFVLDGVDRTRLEMILEASKTKLLKPAPADPFEEFESQSLEEAI